MQFRVCRLQLLENTIISSANQLRRIIAEDDKYDKKFIYQVVRLDHGVIPDIKSNSKSWIYKELRDKLMT